MSGEQEDEDLFAQLGRVEAAVLGALGLDEEGEQVLAVAGGRPSELRRPAMMRSQTSYSARWTAAARRLAGVGQLRGTLSGL